MTLLTLIPGGGIINLGILFVLVLLSSFGVPGGFVAMVSSGAIAANVGNIFIIILVALGAAVLGDISVYELSRKFSLTIKRKLQKYKFYSAGEPRARSLLSKYEFFSVFITRFFLTALCAVTSYISGFERLNRRKYYLAVISGEALYAVIYTLLGYTFKLAWDDLVNVLDSITSATILIAIVVLVTAIIVYVRKKLHKPKNISYQT